MCRGVVSGVRVLIVMLLVGQGCWQCVGSVASVVGVLSVLYWCCQWCRGVVIGVVSGVVVSVV